MTTASTLLPATYPRFRYDGSGDLARIGLIYIASSVVMEEEMWAMSGVGVSTHTARIKPVSYTHLTLPTKRIV